MWAGESEPEALTKLVHRAVHRRLGPEFLEHVVELHAKGGVPAVQAEYPTTERNVYRWLERAAEAEWR